VLKETLRRAFVLERAGGGGPAPGIHSFTGEADGRAVRYHLRVDGDGAGFLLADATRVLTLSPVGVAAAAGLLAGTTTDALTASLHRRFKGVTKARLAADVAAVGAAIRGLSLPGGDGPVANLDDASATARTRALSAPLCADLRLCTIETGEAVLARLWDAGVPQVVVVVPPGADTGSLVRLVEHAGDLGMITGVRARATDLRGAGLLDALVAAGVDHFDLGFAGDPALHDALFGEGDHLVASGAFEAAQNDEIFATAVVPLIEDTVHALDEVLEMASGMGAGAAVAHAVVQADGAERALAPGALRQAAATCEAFADTIGLNVVFATPTVIDNGTDLEAAVRAGPRASGEATMAIDAEGRVLPPRGGAEPVGDLVRAPLASIWSAPCFTGWREPAEPPERCDACPGLATCDAGCPSDPSSWARHTGGPK